MKQANHESFGRRRSGLLVALLVFLVLGAGAQTANDDERSSPVGVTVWIRDIVLPGSELEVKPSDVTTPVALRIAAVYPHGTSHRYDLVYYGLDPGDHDLRDRLRRRDGTSTEDLPEIPITVYSILAPGQVQPNRTPTGDLPRLGGYRLVLWIGGVVWVVGLVVILARGRRSSAESLLEHSAPKTLAERLRPLVEAARAGTLSDERRAELELALIAFWRRKIGLQDVSAAEAIAELQRHAEAGPLLRALEAWLHRPSPPPDVDIGKLLAPYRDLPADVLDPPPPEAD